MSRERAARLTSKPLSFIAPIRDQPRGLLKCPLAFEQSLPNGRNLGHRGRPRTGFLGSYQGRYVFVAEPDTLLTIRITVKSGIQIVSQLREFVCILERNARGLG
jgi:hypothetical protein